ncbi:multidrug resistance-associated ABC transporter [Obba rivulosa]|uniref:Multidrug resistance-associated ABC transporter n=1 Tax=Obba rivulosa TaxID=1052685 RepID=A0A8E2AH31_9APHY|nr:multidrug resistance-associated ABC transporter [Obba rivulosa]
MGAPPPAGDLFSSLQTVLSEDVLRTQVSRANALPNENEIWHISLVIPAGIASVSAALLLLHLVLRSKAVKALRAIVFTSKAAPVEDTSPEFTIAADEAEPPHVGGHVESVGGPVIFIFRCARLLCCLALLTLSMLTVIIPNVDKAHSGPFTSCRGLDLSLCGVYAYATLLSLVSVLARQQSSKLACRHLVTVLFSTWAVYVYRDIWPLATFTLSPLDAGEGWMFWTKFAILSMAGVVIPLIMPRQYIPLDPKDQKQPSPEQTASLLSLAFYVYVNPLIMKAYRTSHLKLDELPPVADHDMAKPLIQKSFPHLDPFKMKKDRHLFLGILIVFWKEWFILSLMLVIRVLTQLASPIGMNKLLAYLETGGEGAVVRPWIWILWLFLGPVVGSLAFQRYVFVGTRMTRQAQAILTSLIFDHSLRIRVKVEDNRPSSTYAGSSATATPDTTSVVESTEGGSADGENESEESTIGASTLSANSSAKAKQKAKADNKRKPVFPPPAGQKSKNLVGRLNNLVTVDIDKITNAREWIALVVMVPLQTGLSIWFLYTVLGWSSFVGLAVMLALFPAPGYITSLTQKVQREKMKKTDARVQAVTDTMSVARMIKLFGWESRMSEQIAQKRTEELVLQKRYQILNLSVSVANYVIPLVTLLATLFTYTIIMKQELSASKLFSSISVFDILRRSLGMTLGFVPLCIQGNVSLERVQDFLRNTELLDQFTSLKEGDAAVARSEAPLGVIGIREAAFTWANESDGSLTPGSQRRKFILRIEDDLIFERGQVTLIVGPTGSGKTSILMALLGEMHYIPSGPNSFVVLPRGEGVAYAAQESWVQNETIRDNILFGSPYDEERYNKVIMQCALQRDLSLFDAGDQTEVGEKGLTLSGGQKARVTLARAIYSPAEILLLDDVLAALDVHTAKWIVDKCLKGDLVRGRTVILVTHNVAVAGPIADFVVSLDTDGRIASQGSLDLALAKNAKLLKEVREEEEEVEKAEQETDEADLDASVPQNTSGKLVVQEEIAVGHVGWTAFNMYIKALGGSYPLLFWVWCIGGIFTTNAMIAIQIWFLGYWAAQYEDHDPNEVHVGFYLGLYSAMLLLLTFSFATSWIVWVIGGLRASAQIHRKLISSILGTTLRWLDKTPVSRIITRCTQDMDALDSQLTRSAFWMIDGFLDICIRYFSVVAFSPVFSVPGAVIAGLGGWCGQMYLKAQLCVKREMSNAKAPVIAHFGAAIAGLTSIRAYGAQEAFRQESMNRVNNLTRAAVPFYDLTRWVTIRLDVLGGIFASSLAAYLVYVANIQASNIGFSLNMAVGFSGLILMWIRNVNELEVNANSLERVEQYLEIEHEPKSSPDGVPPAYWPASGELKVEKLSARYSLDGPCVLHEVSFEVKSGERIGIVGRTGSGKSSLTLALLRAIITEGKVYYDGLPTDAINLDALRTNITIIPQVPELLSGTLRQNLDPFGQYDDTVLNDALRAAGLFSLQSQDDEGRITLDSEIASGGSNLSVGQRQILALARTIVRQSKILILDEATSAIDYATDAVIQQSLRSELGKNVTLLIVAHRLQTIMDADKIMVLDAGRIAEFDKPSELLKNPQGLLHALVEESGEKDALYEMVKDVSS